MAEPSGSPPVRKRADSRRNEQALLEAAAEVFVASGVKAPVRDIVARAGVGMGTVYRHFPTRADLIVAVYRHQVEACAQAGPALLASVTSPYAALRQWIDRFVDLLVTKHGLADVMRSDDPVPACDQLLRAAADQHEISSTIEAFELLYAVGNLCASAGDARYDARRMVGLLLDGLHVSGGG